MTKQRESGVTEYTKPSGQLTSSDRKNDLQALIAAIHHGDTEAFNTFYMGYGDSIVRFLTKFLGNLDDAKEVTQETFILLWENREKLDPNRSIKAYTGKVARDLAVNLIRARGKFPESDTDLQLYKEELAGVADERLVAEEVDILYKDALRRMPPQRRRIFEMSREEGLSYNEIADRLNISYNTVKFHMQAALSDIRSALATLIILFFLR